jgi:folate-dependent phosphoribosylglycinamide formyltransferase PurN
MSSPPIAVLALRWGPYPARIVQRLTAAGARPDLLLLGSGAALRHAMWNTIQSVRAQHGLAEVWRRQRWSRAVHAPTGAPTPAPEALLPPGTIHRFDDVNEGAVIAALLGLGETLTILAGSGIVRAGVIAASRHACLNGHPAVLPGIRGTDVVEWAALEDRPYGVSVHRVVPSVDAGPILAVESMTPASNEPFLAFRNRIEIKQAELLADTALAVRRGGQAEFAHDLSRSVLRRRMRVADMRAAEARYRARHLAE